MAKVFTITEGLENMGALRTGGQGSVYKGRRMGPIITAVKLLPTPIHSEDKEDKNFKDFQNEVEKLKKVNEEHCPNVVKILNSGLTESGSFPFIEMEYIEGPDLEELLKEPHDPVFAIREVIKLADQLANALAHCHKVDVKHGDIKSNNVKFNLDTGNYILLDFGLAVMSDEQRRSSLRHAGAIEFMAPEQHEGEMLFQSDIYSYGVVIYELLAGTVPFALTNKGETARNSVMVSHMESPIPDVMDLRWHHLPQTWPDEKKEREMHVPKWLLDIVAKCLEKDPQKRYSNGVELQDAIMQNSTQSMHTKEEVDEVVSVLQSENERLRSVILQQQEGVSAPVSNEGFVTSRDQPPALPVRRNVISISKPVFFSGLLLFAGLAIYAAGNLFKSNAPTSVVPVTEAPAVTSKRTTGNSVVKRPAIINKDHSSAKPAITGPKKEVLPIENSGVDAGDAKKKLSDSLHSTILQTIQQDSAAIKKAKLHKSKKVKKNIGSDVPFF